MYKQTCIDKQKDDYYSRFIYAYGSADSMFWDAMIDDFERCEKELYFYENKQKTFDKQP